jgi:hypothetical protein
VHVAIAAQTWHIFEGKESDALTGIQPAKEFHEGVRQPMPRITIVSGRSSLAEALARRSADQPVGLKAPAPILIEPFGG